VRERLRRIGVARLLGRRRSQVQELTHGLKRLRAIGAGERAIVTDAMETLGEDMGEEAADELADVERHGGRAAGSLDPKSLTLNVTLRSSSAIRRRFEMATR